MFASEGATAAVDGAEAADLDYDPALMGSWTVVTPTAGHRRQVTVTTTSGEELASFEVEHVPGTDG